MTGKITVEQVLEWEKDQYLEALGEGIELNDLFLDRYCNQEFSDLLSQVPEQDRGFVLSGLDVRTWWNGSPAGGQDQHVWISCDEIEIQFEGTPEEAFEEPEEFYIDDNSDLAYLYVGYGLSIDFDHEQLTEAVKDYLETYQ